MIKKYDPKKELARNSYFQTANDSDTNNFDLNSKPDHLNPESLALPSEGEKEFRNSR